MLLVLAGWVVLASPGAADADDASRLSGTGKPLCS